MYIDENSNPKDDYGDLIIALLVLITTVCFMIFMIWLVLHLTLVTLLQMLGWIIIVGIFYFLFWLKRKS